MKWSASTWSPSRKRSTKSLSHAAQAIAQARLELKTLHANDVPIDAAIAYEVQELVLDQLRPAQEIVGFKLGYTSQVMRQAMGIDEPNHGALFDSMVVSHPAIIDGLIQPKAEPEVAIRIDGQGSILGCFASLEVVDSVWSNYEFTWAHNTADGSSAAYAVIGARIDARLEGISVTMTSSSGHSCSAQLRDTCPDISGSLEWLAKHPHLPRNFRDGDVILTGGLTAPLDLEPDGWISARFDAPGWSTDVTVQRRESA